MVAISIQQDVRVPASTEKGLSRILVESGIKKVLNEAFAPGSHADLRSSIMSVVYNYDSESFEIRWDLAK